MLTFTNEQSLQVYINQMIGNVLQKEVANTVIEQQRLSQHILNLLTQVENFILRITILFIVIMKIHILYQ